MKCIVKSRVERSRIFLTGHNIFKKKTDEKHKVCINLRFEN